MKIDLNFVFLIVICIFILYEFIGRDKTTENFADTTTTSVTPDQIKQMIRDIYLADIDAIRNLSNVATKLSTGGYTTPGNLTVSDTTNTKFVNATGKINIGSNANPKDFPDWLGLSVEHPTTDSHIRLKTKNDDNKNIYLIDRDGNFRLNTHGVGDMFGVNRDGHTYNIHTGDHVHNFIGRGDNPYITLGKEGEWNNKSWYLQNVKNDGTNKIFRIGVHGEGAKLDIDRNGNTYVQGKLFVNGRDVLNEMDNFFNNIAVRKDKKYGIQSSRGGYLSDQGGWKPRPTADNYWEVMKFDQLW